MGFCWGVAMTRVVNGLLLLVVLSAVGCNQAVGTVQGKVTLKNVPVTEGSVIFQGTTSVSGNLQADGSYKIASANMPGLPPGDYKVAISPSKIGSGEVPLAVAPGQTPPPKVVIPQRYHSVETSGLAVTVKAGENAAFNFDLQE